MPADFVARDHELESAHEHVTEELAQHRWHWTRDESNPDRVAIKEYARRVGRNQRAIQMMVHGYEAWKTTSDVVPGGPVKLHDFIERERMGAERVEATQAVAVATGKSFGGAAHPRMRHEVSEVLDTARDRAERKGTTVSEELPQVAEWRVKAKKASQNKRDAKRQSRFMLVEFEGHIGYAMRRLRAALAIARDVDFDAEETEVLADTIERLRTVVELIDVRITGETGVDWDSEFAKVMES